MLTRTRRRGAPIGNFNALKHGRRSPRLRAVRAAERRAEAAEDQKRFEAWVAPREQAYRAQHARIIAEIERERAERAKTEPHLWPPIDL